MMVRGFSRFFPQANNAKKLNLQPPLNKIVVFDIVQPHTNRYVFDEPLFGRYALTAVPAT
ncbi:MULTISPECIES: hypothetical protein [Bartonella]|uniref:hypothetical protein n=1 Tax=Bartonella TaxID=773 RepID=UPI00058DF9B5|nr:MULTISPECIES: hypothetical protein [Bartonella]